MELHAGPSEASTIIHWMDIEHADLLSSDGKEGRRTEGSQTELLPGPSRAFLMPGGEPTGGQTAEDFDHA